MKKIYLSLFMACSVYASVAQTTLGLIAYWAMDGNYIDSWTNGIHGTNYGSTPTTNSGSMPNRAMQFLNPTSAVPQYATHPVNALLNFGVGQDFTICLKMYANSPFVHAGGLYDNNLNYSGPGIYFWNGAGSPNIQFNFRNASVGSTAIPLGVWKNVVCLKQGSATKIYIDGVLNATGTVGTMTPVYSYPARFGTMFYNGFSPPQYNGFNGKIDNVRIYNRALGPGEIIGILPIRLNSFAATNNHASILLNWQTAYEQETARFNLQRITNGTDFSTIAVVQAKGGPTVTTDYQYTDNTAKDLKGVAHVFYRLEMVDKHGNTELSPVVQVKLDLTPGEFTILRNPVVNDLQLEFNSTVNEETQLLITDAWGRQLLTRQLRSSAGTVSTSIKFETFAPGTYYVTIANSFGKLTRSFIKQ